MSDVEEGIQKLAKLSLEIDQGIMMSEQMKWGLPLKEVYKHALTFFKGWLLIFITRCPINL